MVFSIKFNFSNSSIILPTFQSKFSFIANTAFVCSISSLLGNVPFCTSIRTTEYRLDASNQLYDMIRDTAQTTDVSKIYPASYNDILFKKKQWENELVATIPLTDERPLLIGDPLFINDVLPASEANARGNIVRSSIHEQLMR